MKRHIPEGLLLVEELILLLLVVVACCPFFFLAVAFLLFAPDGMIDRLIFVGNTQRKHPTKTQKLQGACVLCFRERRYRELSFDWMTIGAFKRVREKLN